jgi:AcrR family transcriptional regulator
MKRAHRPLEEMTGKRNARQRLLDATVDLLWSGGLIAASPAAVAERAGAGKMSMYRHFSGKDELVAEALKDQDPRQRAFVLGEPDLAPRERLLAVFEKQADRADRSGHRYRGCPFVRAQLQLSAEDHPAGPVIGAHKDEMVRDLTDILAEAGVRDPEAIAPLVLMMFDGAAIHAAIRGSGEPFRQARAWLDDLLTTGQSHVSGTADSSRS